MIHSSKQARKLILTFICFELLLVVLYGTDAWVEGPAGRLNSLIDLDAEGNLPAWFSSFQLALISIGLWVLAARNRATCRPSRRFLRVCGGLFLLLSIDETALLHERVTESLGSRYIDWVPVYLSNHVDQAIVCALVLAACLAAALSHLAGVWRMSPTASLIAAAGCAIYATGAAVLESIGYRLLNAGASLTLYRTEVAVEELFEMLGASFILYAVLLLCIDRGRSQPHIRASPMVVPQGLSRASLTTTSR